MFYLVKVSFSRDIILSKLSVFPYYIVVIILSAEVAENAIIMMTEDFYNLTLDIENLKVSWLSPALTTFLMVKFYFFMMFAMSQIFEWSILRKFIQF